MSAQGIRARVSSVIQHQGPTANLHTAIVSREMVPMREEIFTGEQLMSPSQVAAAFHLVQRHVSEATQSARSSPSLGGHTMPSLTFAANTPQTLQHGCEKNLPVAWQQWSRRPAAANSVGCLNEVSQNATLGTITMQSTDAATYDVYFFTRPGALR